MIKKLRLTFVVMFMSIVTVLLVVIFGLVYYFNKEYIETTNIAMMEGIAGRTGGLELPDSPMEEIRLPYFVVHVGSDNRMTWAEGSYYDLSDKEFIQSLIDRTMEQGEHIGVIEEYHLRYCHVRNPVDQVIVYSDISSEQAILENLMWTCILVGVVSFFLFLLLSIFFAGCAVRPIDQAWRQQKRFVEDASHELKTPLTVIMTNAELLQNPVCDEAGRMRYSSGILAMSRQMKKLVEELLELARADNALPLRLASQVDFSALVLEAVLPFEPVFYEKGLELKTDIEEHLTVKGDGEKLKQAVDVLLDNAQKYSLKHGKTAVSLKRRGKGRLLLSVASEGEEIPQKELNNLFRRFYRADKARSYDGSFGLGLSIAESIIRWHGGKIWAQSRGGVNTFFVELRYTPPSGS